MPGRQHAVPDRRLLMVPALMVLCWVLLASCTAYAELVDRVAAAVNNDVITLSDLRQAVVFNTAAGGRGTGRILAVETLEGLINRKLLLQEAYRLRFVEVSEGEVAAEMERFQGGFGSDEEYRQFLSRAGMTERQLRRMLGERLVVERFVEQKIGLYARVNRDDVQSYYREHQEAFAGRRFSEVQQEIEALLSSQMAMQQLDSYLAELRTRATIRVNPLEERDGF